MQHIVNIAFDFDDEKVKSIAEDAVSNELDSIIRKIVLDHIAPISISVYGDVKRRNWDTFDSKTREIIEEFLEANKDEILDRAATKLSESYKRTKAWKEKAEEALS
jgi:hypothetical protein